MRGRKPKPTHLRVLEGNRENRPIGQEVQLTVLPAPPEAPDDLSPEAKGEWDRLKGELWHVGLLTAGDEQTFKAYCNAYGRWVVAERKLAVLAAQDPQTAGLMIRTTGGNAIMNPLVGIANTACRDMVRYAVELGLTPSARARIAAAPPQAQSKFSGLLGSAG